MTWILPSYESIFNLPISDRAREYQKALLQGLEDKKRFHKGDEITIRLNPDHPQYGKFRNFKRGDTCTISVNNQDVTAVLVSKYKDRLTFSVSR